MTVAQLLKHDFKSKGSLYLHDAGGNQIYYENLDGHWIKQEYDANGNSIYYENSNGFWSKRDYDLNGDCIYFENSIGEVIDNRLKKGTCDGKVVEIDGKKYKLTEV